MKTWQWLVVIGVIAYVAFAYRGKIADIMSSPNGPRVTGDTSGLGGGGAINPLMGGSPAGCASRNDGIIGTACKL